MALGELTAGKARVRAAAETCPSAALDLYPSQVHAAVRYAVAGDGRRRRHALVWLLAGLSAMADIATGLFHEVGSPLVLVSALTLSLLLFAFAHGSVRYRLRDLVAFAIICIAVSNALENLSVLTGFPFGRYHYTEMLGPKLLHVPLLIGPAYFALGYLAWTLAHVILRVTGDLRGSAVFTVPLTAAFALVAVDLSFDPLLSSARQLWVWHDGGSYLGVPVSNFLGWYLTGYLFFQLFALYLSRYRRAGVEQDIQSREYWFQAILIYGMIGGIVILCAFTAATPGTVSDAAGTIWRIRDIYAACALVCTFTMGTFTLLALVTALRALPRRT